MRHCSTTISQRYRSPTGSCRSARSRRAVSPAKIVYTHGGHGITADNKGNGKWTFQRGEGHEMIEDLGNIDQMTFLVDYLFRAGATIAPQRPVGHQTNEVVMDNDDPGVTFVGKWTDGKESIYFGKAGGVPYKQARTSKKETAYARYTPEDSGGRLLSGLRLDELGRATARPTSCTA